MIISRFSKKKKKKKEEEVNPPIFAGAKVLRVAESDQGTLGLLTFNDQFVCYVIELPSRKNRRGVSRIPAGSYTVDFLKRSASGKYREVYHVSEVPDRSGILVHSGNLAGDVAKGHQSASRGCLLPGLRVGRLSGQLAVLQSKAAMRRLHKFTGKKTFTLEIENA